MPRKNDSWGIEVGADAIKAIQLVREADEVRLAAYEVIPFKKVLTTPDLNVDEAIQMGLDQFMSRHDVAKSAVTVSVPGHMAFARFAKLPPVEPKKIPDIVKFEAVQQIPFPIDQVEWDYQVFAQEDSPDVEVGIFAITKERVNQFLRNYQAVKMHVDALTLSPLAVYNGLAYDMDLKDDGEGVILMDIGTTSTDVIIVESGRIWLRTLPIGGNNFTEALVRAFNLSFPKAEKLKREAGTSKYARQIFQAMRPVFADLVQEVQRSLGFYQSLNRDAHLGRLVGVGSTFRLPGLQKFLKQQLQIEVDRPSSADGKLAGFRRLSAEGAQAADFSERAMNLATAYGLALQGLGLARVEANILPAQILRQRMWRSKQPWMAAAAAVLALAAGMATAKLWTAKSAYDLPAAENNKRWNGENGRPGVYAAATSLVSQYKQLGKNDPRLQIEEVRGIFYYRDFWSHVAADLDGAFGSLDPQPELLRPDYDAIRRIGRSQRRRLYIDIATVTELPSSLPDDWSASGPSKIGSTTGSMTGYSPLAAASGLAPVILRQELNSPKAFLIDVRGTSPYADADMMVLKIFEWLTNHAKVPGRPYEIVINNKKHRLVPRAVSGGPGGFGGVPGPGGGFAPPPPRGEPGGPPGLGLPGSAGSITDWSAYVPTRPLATESHSTPDWEFEVQWVVQVLEPKDFQKPMPDALQPATTAPATQPAQPTGSGGPVAVSDALAPTPGAGLGSLLRADREVSQ